MKKVLLTLVTVALVLSCIFAFVACGKKNDVNETDTNIGGNQADSEITGDKVIAATDDMTGEEMFLNAVKNFDLSKYSAVLQVGDVNTEVMGGTVIQKVEGLRIRDNGQTFMYNNSYTAQGPVNIKVMEQYYVATDGSVRYISTEKNKNVEVVDGVLTAKKWPINNTYGTVSEYTAVNPNDPTVLNMYVLNEDVVTETTKPTLSEDGKYYSFNVTCDGAKAFVNYIPVMEYMLNQSVPGKVNPKAAQTLTFEVQIWKDGLFKQYNVSEGYSVKVLGIIDGGISLNSLVKFSYDPNERPFTNYYKDGEFTILG